MLTDEELSRYESSSNRDLYDIISSAAQHVLHCKGESAKEIAAFVQDADI